MRNEKDALPLLYSPNYRKYKKEEYINEVVETLSSKFPNETFKSKEEYGPSGKSLVIKKDDGYFLKIFPKRTTIAEALITDTEMDILIYKTKFAHETGKLLTKKHSKYASVFDKPHTGYRVQPGGLATWEPDSQN